jgi:hypothetical protein
MRMVPEMIAIRWEDNGRLQRRYVLSMEGQLLASFSSTRDRRCQKRFIGCRDKRQWIYVTRMSANGHLHYPSSYLWDRPVKDWQMRKRIIEGIEELLIVRNRGRWTGGLFAIRACGSHSGLSSGEFISLARGPAVNGGTCSPNSNGDMVTPRRDSDERCTPCAWPILDYQFMCFFQKWSIGLRGEKAS